MKQTNYKITKLPKIQKKFKKFTFALSQPRSNLNATPQLTAALTINCSNCAALIHGLDMF